MSKTKDKTVWFGMKLTPEQKEKIRMLARRRGVTQKKAVMDLVEEKTRETDFSTPKNSFLDGIEHLSGSLSGPEDLSVNLTHMKDFGR